MFHFRRVSIEGATIDGPRRRIKGQDRIMRIGQVPWSIGWLSLFVGLSLPFLSVRQVLVVAPAITITQAIVMRRWSHRYAQRDRMVWHSFCGGILLFGVTCIGMVNVHLASEDVATGVDASVSLHQWRAITAAAMLANSGFYLWGAARAFRSLLHVPSISLGAKIGLAAMAAELSAAQWLLSTLHLTGTAWVVAVVLACGGAIAMIVAAWIGRPQLIALGRQADMLLVYAGVIFCVGEAIVIVACRGSTLSAGTCVAHSVVASGLLVVAAGMPSMASIGAVLPALTDRRSNNVPPMLLVAIVVADAGLAALAGLTRGTWARSAIVFVLAVVVALEFVLIVGLSGMLFSTAEKLRQVGRRTLRRDLRAVVAAGGLQAHFQPIVRASDEARLGYEALVRWPHPRHGMLAAQRFIQLAADEGHLAAIDRLMLRRAGESLPHLRLTIDSAFDAFATVNVEPLRLQQPGFAADVLADFEKRNLDPRGLIIEMTETSGVDDWDELRANVELFQAAGIGLAVDDFGSGHANFGLLVNLDPKIVKLDKSLILAALGSSKGGVVVRNAIQAARACGAQIVGEGVSDPTWRASLAGMGFDMLQGYGFGKPAAASTFVQHEVVSVPAASR